MKKTFTINISGIIFHIDDDAYERLNRYLDTIKRHFSGTEGSEEIINDIEMRIAEILQGKLSEKKQVINLGDVDEVIAIMGEPSEFDDTEEEETSSKTRQQDYYRYQKRLYRDPENKILGGVSGGLGAYFNIDPVWIRLIFVLLAVFSGIGILLYLVLWIVVPIASTTAERLEMKGEPVNVSNIERSIREEVDHLKNKINDLTDEAKRTFKKKSSQVRSGTDPVANFIREAGHIFLKILVALVGLIVLLVGVGLAVALVAAVLGISRGIWVDGVEFFPLPDVMAIMLENPSNLPVVTTTLLLVFGIPVFMLLVTGVRLLFALPRQKTLAVIAFNVWLIAFIVLIVFAVMTGTDFRNEEAFVKKTEWAVPPGNTLYVELSEDELMSYDDHVLEIDNWEVVVSEEGRVRYASPELRIERSNTDDITLVVEAKARGKNPRIAMERASAIEYTYMFEDSVLTLGSLFSPGAEAVWRDQEVDLTLKVPEGTIISIGEGMHSILGFHRNFNRHEMSGKRFIIGPDGLSDPDDHQEIQKDEEPTSSSAGSGVIGFIVTGLRYF